MHLAKPSRQSSRCFQTSASIRALDFQDEDRPTRLVEHFAKGTVTVVLYLLAIFCAPLALLLIGKWFQAILNLVLYVVALVFAVTIIFFHFAFIVWIVGVVHVVLVINNHRADRRAQAIIAATQDKRS